MTDYEKWQEIAKESQSTGRMMATKFGEALQMLDIAMEQLEEYNADGILSVSEALAKINAIARGEK